MGRSHTRDASRRCIRLPVGPRAATCTHNRGEKTMRLRRQTFQEIPITGRMTPRPVWARLERRFNGEELGPPTDEEKHDAILVLQQELRHPRSLHAEALRIVEECSRPD